MPFKIAPAYALPAELPGALYDAAQDRADQNLYLKLAELDRLDRAQREESRLADARLQLGTDQLDWERQQWNTKQDWERQRWNAQQGWELNDSALKWYQALNPRGAEDPYQYITTPDGQIVAVNRMNPKDVRQVYTFTPKDSAPDGSWNTGGGGSGRAARIMPYGGVVGTGPISNQFTQVGASPYMADMYSSPPVVTPEASQGFALPAGLPPMFRGYPNAPQLPVMTGMTGAAFPEGFDPARWTGQAGVAPNVPAPVPLGADLSQWTGQVGKYRYR